MKKKVRYIYQLELPLTIKIYNIFSLDRLQEMASNFLPRQIQQSLELIKINNNKE